MENNENINIEKIHLTPPEEQLLAELEEKAKKWNEENNCITIDDCTIMTWKMFEIFVGKLYAKMGYKVEKTSGGGDHGCDLILSKNGRKTVVDVKHWKTDIHSKVVGQILRAISYYDANNGIIIGISNFTKWTIDEAEKNQIELVDRDSLERLLYDYPITREKKSGSELTIDDVYEDNVNYREIAREMMKFILKKIPGWTGLVKGSTIQKYLRDELKMKLISPSDQTKIADMVVQFLKDDNFAIDLTKDVWWDVPKEPDDMLSQEYIYTAREKAITPSAKKESLALRMFMETLSSLEGEPKSSVPEQDLVDELVKLEEFSEEGAKNHIRRMIRDASIYESKPGHYNTV